MFYIIYCAILCTKVEKQNKTKQKMDVSNFSKHVIAAVLYTLLPSIEHM